MPIVQSQATAIGYHSSADNAFALKPLGHQGNEGALQSAFHKLFGGGGGHPTWYQLDGGATSALDVGGAPGTSVFAPVDGTIVGLTPYIVAGRRFGSRIDIQPQSAPSLDRLHHAGARRPVAEGRRQRRQRCVAHRRCRGSREGRAPGARALHERRGQPRLDRASPGGDARPELRLLFLADVFGVAGRRAVEERLRGLRDELGADICIVNGENVADGAGITAKLADKLLAAGADVITLGNHTYRRDGIGDYLARSETVIRPANAGSWTPGHGLAVVEARNGVKVAVLNLLGSLYLDTPHSPWEVVDALVDEARERAPVVVLDFHAEATSEKVAMARWLDGRVTAVIGTHTHVQTNDARVLPGGTAAITDAGHDGPARLGDRREGRARDPPHADAPAGALRAGRGRRADRGRRRRLLRRRPGDAGSSCCGSTL